MMEFPDRRPLVSKFVAGMFMGFAAPALLLTAMAHRPSSSSSPAQVLAHDWETIGRDFYRAIRNRPRSTSDKAA